VRLEGLGELKNPMAPIGNRTRDLPICSIVPQPTTLPRAPGLENMQDFMFDSGRTIAPAVSRRLPIAGARVRC
jgi:hypothetical protein